jgi:hypothetical protein
MWTPFLATQDGELLAEREVLSDEAGLRPERGAKRAEDGHQEGEHDRTFAEGVGIVSGESVARVG